ncbi:HECT-like ubiquitin conjugating enzyme-binding domain containing protein [Colletotrichum sojae]|uniref:HECT-like ubiquitin conjugating enzyme-binding domain containing protein n=1 Tax=Colletotrichum sojae TaxID=2175907 RepID=A0A8H6MZ74_9PEZI|nr:HECT-like ubiquitin conjugating enzyme-binding domain containing protein [Colletotrichum sojae]
MSPRDAPSVYAELLTNIRQLSVAVSLPSPADSSTAGSLTADGATLHLRHAGTQTSLPLPGKVQVSRAAALPAPLRGSRAIAWRLPLAEAQTPPPARSTHDEPVPWTATDLLPGSSVSCRGCSAVLVSEGRAGEWKDLPSENWAEMMDFWHCHKPTDHEDRHDHEHLEKRGYGASSSIAAQPGVGMVDLTSFLLCESDCTELLFSSSFREAGSDTSSAVLAGDASPPPRVLHVSCSGCKAHVGFFNVAIFSVVLLKWQVSCQTTTLSPPPTSTECLAATLLATLSRSGSSKSVVVPTFSTQGDSNENSPALHLWILNGNITYASSEREGSRAAIKLLFREIPQREADAMLESMTSDVQEVTLPAADLVAAAEVLRRSNGLLPPGERAFKEWSVGLLDKWRPGS